MNLVFGTFDELKAHLLNEGLREQTTYDSAIEKLGRGVAARFEKFCDRKFARVEGDTFEVDADRQSYCLPRFPLEQITKLEQRDDLATGWVDLGAPAEVIFNLREKSGLVEFAAPLGLCTSRLRFTFDGGFWLNESGSSAEVARRIQRGAIALAQNDESKAIVLETEISGDYSIALTVVAPNGGMIINATPSAKTGAGCTALLSFPIPAAGYTLEYIALADTTSDPESSQPDGATELPADLKLAWLLQGEYIWKLRDKLGINLAPGVGGEAQLVSLTLAGAKLIPEVEEILRGYRRYAL